MKKIEQYRTTIRGTAITLFCLVSTYIYYFIWQDFYNPFFRFPYDDKGKLFITFEYFAVLFVTSLIMGMFKIDKLRKSEIIIYEFIALLFSNAIAYAQICLIEAVIAPIGGMLAIILLEIAALVGWAFLSSKVVYTLSPPEKLIIIYGSHLATEIVYKMSQMEDKFVITESANVDEGFEGLVHKIDRYEGVIICDVPARLRNDILKYCYQQNKVVYVIPKISDILIRSASDITYFDSPIMKCSSTGLTVEQRAVKRLIDIVLSLVGIIVSAPIMILVALAIKLYDRGPVFYKQKRCTKDLKTFDIIKFRSMVVDAEKDGPQPAIDNDKRITPVGKIIRSFRLDELPQLFNILKGEMSVVGPRPERIEHVAEYSEQIPEFVNRYKVKGGLTGYAQIFGKYNTSAYNKLKMDLIYIQNYSLLLDLKLIIMTFKILFKKESTEGFDVSKKTKTRDNKNKGK